jgi:preprotein translocase SecE subunit
VAKTRAQRKAEKRAREARLLREGSGEERAEESHAQHDTQVPISGDVAEFEAAVETGQPPPEDVASGRAAVPGITPETPQPAPPAPAPSRADPPPPAAPAKLSRREQRARKKEEAEKAKRQADSEARQARKEPAGERRRGGVIGFFASCWAELKRVQWPDRDTLVQASAVTLVFVAVMAAYLGALDAVFNFLVKRIL